MNKKLNFGCGNDIRKDWDNCDVQKGEGVISFDFNKVPYPIKPNTYDLIESRSVLQMLTEPDVVLNELWRISKDGAIIKIEVPYWHNKGAYNDIQTKHLFNENSFINFAEQKPCRIDTKSKFKIISIVRQPTLIGKFMPDFVRRKLDLVLSGIYGNMNVVLKVTK